MGEVITMKGYEALPVERCGACAHFRRHFVRIADGFYSPLSYGHCVYPKSKKRREEEHCPHWSAAGEEGFGKE